jgi:AraC-like DNA-binding protein
MGRIRNKTNLRSTLPRLAASNEMKKYRWSNRDRRTWKRRFWRCPATRPLFELIRSGHTGEPKCRAIASVLPVLAVSTWPVGTAEWTRRATLSLVRIAALSGTSITTVRHVIRFLKKTNTLQSELISQGPSNWKVFSYRLHVPTCYAAKDEQFVRISAELFYGGWWAFMPNHSMRQLHLTIAALDPIRDERAYRRALDRQSPDELKVSLDYRAIISQRRDDERYSLRTLAEITGLSKPTVVRSVRLLRRRFNANGGTTYRYLKFGRRDTKGVRWYAPRRLSKWALTVDFLNDPNFLKLRRHEWIPNSPYR